MKKKEQILMPLLDLKNPKKVELFLKKRGRGEEIDIVRKELINRRDRRAYVVVKSLSRKISPETKREFRLELSLQQAILSGAFNAVANVFKK